MTDAVQLAKSVLAAGGQPFATLSLASNLPPVTADTAVADARRSYMRLAGAIHPDRLQGSFDKATEAFQCLVRAFECFADPKSRKKAAAEAMKKTKAAKPASTAVAAPAAAAAVRTSSPKKAEKAKPTKKAAKVEKAPKKSAKSKKAKADSDEEPSESDDDDDDDDEESAAEDAAEEDAWEEWAAADAEPEVSTSRTPIGQPRTGDVYQQTTIGCPKCRSAYEPDSRPQYSLFMGPWGKKVHCQLCLFAFGCATALHNCPHCSTAFDYDVSMYDAVQTCTKCKKKFGFPYYPVNQHLIDQIALEQWRERKDREKAAAREARAQARRGDDGDNDESEKTQLLIGTCIMDEACPLCHQRVKSKHRAHVLACLAKSPEEREEEKKPRQSKAASVKAAAKPSPKADTAVAKAPSPKAVTAKKASPKPAKKAEPKAAKKAQPKTAAKAKAAAKPAQCKRRRSASDSDSSDSEASLSESEEDDMSSESSFSDEDDSD